MLAPVMPSSRSFTRAVEDIRRGFAQRQLWAHLGWQDIKQRYRRSVIGPLWITISMGVLAMGLSILYSLLFGNYVPVYLPFVTTGFIVWGFINGCITEGMEVFISNEGMIKQMPAPLTVYVLRTVWRQILTLAHNMVIYVIILALFFTHLTRPYALGGVNGACNTSGAATCYPGIGWSMLLVIPAFLLVAISGGWVALLFGIISTRFRDFPQVITSFIQLIFYLTPIVWSVDNVGSGHPWAKSVIQLNPLYHYVQVIRGPLLGQPVSWVSWVVVGGMTIVGWAVALVAMRNYRSRISYWV